MHRLFLKFTICIKLLTFYIMKSMSFVDAVKSVVVENYANFNGRARRSEYWYFVLAHGLLNFVLFMLASVFSADVFATVANGGTPNLGALGLMGFLYGLIQLALFIPSLAVATRRLHDIGKSGKLLLLFLLCFVPIINIIAAIAVPILFIVWFCQDSQPGENKWGANPKE